jgi:hypothetical protein
MKQISRLLHGLFSSRQTLAHPVFLSFFFITVSSVHAAPFLGSSYEQVLTALKSSNKPGHDAQLLLNFAYWSCMRSQITLTTQAQALADLKQSWMSWQNCAQTRRNPSTEVPYPQAVVRAPRPAKAKLTHHDCNKTYAAMLEYVTKTATFDQACVKELILKTRSQARLLVATSLTEAFSTFDAEITAAHQALVGSATLFQENNKLHNTDLKNFITQGLLQVLENASVQSFAKLDAAYNKGSDKLFYALFTSQELFTKIWMRIETDRKEYYEQLFNDVRKAMGELKCTSESYYSLFAPQGLICDQANTAHRLNLSTVTIPHTPA